MRSFFFVFACVIVFVVCTDGGGSCVDDDDCNGGSCSSSTNTCRCSSYKGTTGEYCDECSGLKNYDKKDKKCKTNGGAIAGIVVGGISAVLLPELCLLCCWIFCCFVPILSLANIVGYCVGLCTPVEKMENTGSGTSGEALPVVSVAVIGLISAVVTGVLTYVIAQLLFSAIMSGGIMLVPPFVVFLIIIPIVCSIAFTISATAWCVVGGYITRKIFQCSKGDDEKTDNSSNSVASVPKSADDDDDSIPPNFDHGSINSEPSAPNEMVDFKDFNNETQQQQQHQPDSINYAPPIMGQQPNSDFHDFNQQESFNPDFQLQIQQQQQSQSQLTSVDPSKL